MQRLSLNINKIKVSTSQKIRVSELGPSCSDLAERDWNKTGSVKLGLWTDGLADYGLRTGYKTRTEFKTFCKMHIIILNCNLNFEKRYFFSS